MTGRIFLFFIIITAFSSLMSAQNGSVKGKITSDNQPVPFVSVVIKDIQKGTITDSLGRFQIDDIPMGVHHLETHFLGFENFNKDITIDKNDKIVLSIALKENTGILNEVVITGVSRATIRRENPIAVTSVSTREIEQTSESNIVDVLVGNTPGLSSVKTGPNISKPFIRGLGYNRVLTLYDGIRMEGQQWGEEHGLEVDDYNIYRAEVIKGPSSLMYGSDALAGVVSLFPFIPNDRDGKIHGNLLSEYQTNNGLIGNGLRLGYNSGNFVFALRGSCRMAKNYQNPVDGRVYLTNFNEANFSALAGYETEKGHTYLNFTLYDNTQGIPDGSRDSVSRKFTKQVYEDDLDAPENRPLVSDKALNSYKIPALSQRIQYYRLYLKNFYEVGQGELHFTLAGQQSVRREYNHPTMPEQPGMFVRLNTLNYNFRYNAPMFSNIELSVGINGMAQNNKNKNATDFPIPDYDLFDFGGFLYGKWKKEDWTISGGIRYDLRYEEWDDFYIGADPETGFNRQVEPGTAGAELPFPKFSKTFQDVSASVGATYKISNKISLKANIGRAFRAPNITELASNGLDPGAHIIYLGDRTFNPEISLEEDLGISANFKNISAEINVYNNNIQDFIYLKAVADESGNVLVDQQGNRTYKYKQTKAQIYGAEVWFSVHPEKIPGLEFNNSLSVVHGFNRADKYKGKGIKGEYLSLIPPLKIKSELSYQIQPKANWLKGLKPKVGMNYSAVQDRFLGLNESETQTPGYFLFQAGVVSNIQYAKNRTFQFMVQVNNLFNKAYQNHLSRLKYLEDFEDGNGLYNMGRNMTFKLVFPF